MMNFFEALYIGYNMLLENESNFGNLFNLGWTLATNTRYPFPEYAPKGVVREWINVITFIQLTSEMPVKGLDT